MHLNNFGDGVSNIRDIKLTCYTVADGHHFGKRFDLFHIPARPNYIPNAKLWTVSGGEFFFGQYQGFNSGVSRSPSSSSGETRSTQCETNQDRSAQPDPKGIPRPLRLFLGRLARAPFKTELIFFLGFGFAAVLWEIIGLYFLYNDRDRLAIVMFAGMAVTFLSGAALCTGMLYIQG